MFLSRSDKKSAYYNTYRGRTGAVVSVIRCGFEQATFNPCLVLVKPRKPAWTDYDEAGD